MTQTLILDSPHDLGIPEHALPTTPPLVVRCARLRRGSREDLLATLAADPSLAADVLGLVNSPLYDLRAEVQDLHQAIAILGFSRVRDLATFRALVRALDAQVAPPLDRELFWERSLYAGYLASRLAETMREGAGERAFLAGMLSDVGVIQLNHSLPRSYAPVARLFEGGEAGRWLAAERSAVRVGHGDIAAMALERWELPPMLIGAVRWHHASPRQIPRGTPGRGLALLVGLAHRLIDLAWSGDEPREAARAGRRAMAALRLDPAALSGPPARLRGEVPALAAAFGLPIRRLGPLAATLRALAEADRPRAGLSARLAFRARTPGA